MSRLRANLRDPTKMPLTFLVIRARECATVQGFL
jgi:hypothetical protein